MIFISKFYLSTNKAIKHIKTLPINHFSRVSIEQPHVKISPNIINPNIKETIKQNLHTAEQVEKLKSDYSREIFFNKIDATNYYKHLDSNFDSFFANKAFNLDNFNFLIQILSRNKKCDEITQTMERMKELSIEPNIQSYLHLLNSYAISGNIEKSEEIFQIIETKFNGNNILTYNSLMKSYAVNAKPDECQSLIFQMKKNGLEPDVACYTTLIHAYDKACNFDKCWEIFDSLHDQNKDIDKELKMLNDKFKQNRIEILSKPLVEDDYLISMMIKICEKTHDAEKAIFLFRKMEDRGFIPSVIYFNSILAALSSRKSYANQALEMFTKMKLLKVTPNLETFSIVLKATGKLGDLYQANEIIKEIKTLGYEINEYIITGLLNTYASAIRSPLISNELQQEYLTDSWELISYCEDNNIKINGFIANSLLLCYCNAQKWDEVDNRIIPFFNKHKLKLDVHSYDGIVRMLIEMKNFKGLIQVCNDMKLHNIQPNQNILNNLLESYMRFNDVTGITDCLRKLRQMNKRVRGPLIAILINAKNLPDELYIELKYLNETFERKMLTPTFRNLELDRFVKKTKTSDKRIVEH